MSDEERQRLKTDVAKLEQQRVARLWAIVEYYNAKKQPESIEVYCLRIINEHPESEYANKARAMLKSLEKHKKPMFRQPVVSRSKEVPPKAMNAPSGAAQVQLDDAK
jgi:hypothetical protein